MKKAVTLICSLALILSLAAVSVFAAGSGNKITSSGGSASHDVTATYQAGGTGSTVYSVDIEWGAMEFTYTAASAGIWNPNTHSYDGGGEGTWTSTSDYVKVINHSNTAITATLTYTADGSYSGISGSFGDKSTINLATAENTAVDSAPTDTAHLSLSGELNSSATTSTKIGTITVKIS